MYDYHCLASNIALDFCYSTNVQTTSKLRPVKLALPGVISKKIRATFFSFTKNLQRKQQLMYYPKILNLKVEWG